jgi:VPS62-like protein
MLAQAAAALAALNPVVAHDTRESSPLAAVDRAAPAAYGRAVPARAGGTWVQYWLFYAYQDQDRGIVRSGRHEGDWELVQYRVSAAGRGVEAVYAQHSGAERCGIGAVSFRGGRPVVYAAHGSHASYLQAGTRDRMWPDPNDEADGRGLVVRPRLVPITALSPAWMRYPAPWGGSRAARLIPLEQTSPLGPAFQGDRWDAVGFAASAGSCRASCNEVGECDGRETAASFGAVFVALLAGLWLYRRRRGGVKNAPQSETF